MNRVLVVDDEPAILRLLGAVLGRGGYEAVGAPTASAALAQVRHGDWRRRCWIWACPIATDWN
jgi:two-component system KDP operon response regulator KdpE